MRCYALRLIISLFDMLESQQAPGAGTTTGAADMEQQEQQQGQQQGAGPTMPSATLMQVQATLLMHVSTMLRYEAALGSEWIKWMSTEAGSTANNYFMLQVCHAEARCARAYRRSMVQANRLLSPHNPLQACSHVTALLFLLSKPAAASSGYGLWLPLRRCC